MTTGAETVLCRTRLRPAYSREDLAKYPLLERLYRARGVAHGRVEYGLDQLDPGFSLMALDAAAEQISEAVMQQRCIVIAGDYDVDGASSTALAIGVLRACKADVHWVVPDRFEQGYGLSAALVAEAHARYKPSLIVTVDNGVAAVTGIQAAREAGIQVVVTDHHLPPSVLPAAEVIVNPNLPECSFPWKSTAGVGVIFYVLAAVRRRLNEKGWFQAQNLPQPALAQWLDLVALGTVADLVPLERNNRILVAQGLARIRSLRARPGLLALMELGGVDTEHATASDLAFQVAPRLNAAGRLQHIGIGVECLLEDDPVRAMELATELDSLNRSRREMQDTMQIAAERALAGITTVQKTQESRIICLYQADWHEGIVGILAGQIKERYHCPTIVFARGQEAFLKGSARSIPGLHMRDLLAAVDSQCPGLIARFGGHAMAAGVSIAPEHLDTFQKVLRQVGDKWLSDLGPVQVLETDGELQVNELTLHSALAIRDGGPWGAAFPEPQFEGCFEVLEQRILKGRHLKLRLLDARDQRIFDAIAFNNEARPQPGDRVQIVYMLDVNHWQGVTRLQLRIKQLAPAA